MRRPRPVSRARVLLHDALRGPMSAAGWRPRARGWFSRPVDQGWLAVVSAGTAVEHSTPGEGVGHAHLSLRSERVEPLAAQLGGFRDAGQRTVVVMLSDPLPRGRSVTWHVSASTAVRVAEELAGYVEAHGWPFLQQLAGDVDGQLDLIGRRELAGPGLARRVLVLLHAGRRAEAESLLQQADTTRASRDDPAVPAARTLVAGLRALL